MTITGIVIRNFQSLRKVDLELGAFTVIVGPSSSGKSALMRAFRALASNVRGSGMITRGQTVMAITATTDTHKVTLERTDRSGKYEIFDSAGASLTFTKLAGEVPEHVTNVLRIDPVPASGASVNFASQFDKPYLLDESGATVARHLGELTNVNAIFEAVRAANNVRQNAAKTLKTRRGDLEQLRSRLAGFEGLSDRLKALDDAEQLDARRRDLQSRIGRLDTGLRTLRITERAIAKANVPEVPAPDTLNATLTTYLDLQSKLRALAAKQQRFRQAQDTYLTLAMDAKSVQNQLKDTLAEAGVCPTCGQVTA